MRKIFLGLFLAIAAGAAAQKGPRVAFTAGLHSATVESRWNPHPLAVDSLSANTPRTGAHFGFVATVPFGPKGILNFQPGIQFSAKGATQMQTLDTTQNKTLRLTDKQFINYVDVPLNLVLALPLGGKTRFVLGGGPQASLFYNGKTSQTAFDTSRKFTFSELADLPVGKEGDKYRLVHFSLNALAGFEFGRVFLTANWSQSLTPYLTLSEKEFKHSTMGATLGIYLGPQNTGKKPAAAAQVLDKDNDGIPDATDLCPELPGSALTGGCPDRDGDGIADQNDQCPNQKGTAENNGCPPADRDNDGVLDKEDKCPDVAGVAKYGGCPVPDSDKDGLNDEEDGCPQEAGPKENKGCPVPVTAPDVKKAVEEKVAIAARKIAFEHAKAALLPASLPVLDEVASLMQQHGDLKLTIEGHTSTTGNAAANQALSEQRAQKVKAYLQSKGVDASRMTAVGYGASRPVNKGKSDAAQAENRRVELKLEYQ